MIEAERNKIKIEHLVSMPMRPFIIQHTQKKYRICCYTNVVVAFALAIDDMARPLKTCLLCSPKRNKRTALRMSQYIK